MMIPFVVGYWRASSQKELLLSQIWEMKNILLGINKRYSVNHKFVRVNLLLLSIRFQVIHCYGLMVHNASMLLEREYCSDQCGLKLATTRIYQVIIS
jgi:hypothetical protein